MSKYSIILILLGLIFLSSCTKNNVDTSASAQQQLTTDDAAIDAYLQAKGITSYYTDVNGLRYTIKSVGKGFTPRLDNDITVRYKGTILSTQAQFADTITDGATALSEYIIGWQIGMRLLPQGTKATLYLPSVYRYGTTATSTIPANSVLIFDVELTKVTTTTTETAQLASDVAAIDQYLASKNITAVKDTTGLRYVITQTGNGITPGWFTQVTMNVTGRTLTTGTSFYSATLAPSTTTDSRVVNYLRCFQVALQKLPVGSKATLYVPSSLAFGTTGSGDGTVPSNTNIIYDIELTAATN